MRIRIWNAFASNNSGAYSIIGSFPSAEIAEQVAADLVPVIEAHSRWMNAWSYGRGGDQGDAPSPLAQWAADNGLHWTDHDAYEWPEYSGDNVPDVVVAGSQVLIHEAYAVSMPRVFGEFFYRRAGRVDVELIHTHHPLVAVLNFWVHSNSPTREDDKRVAYAALDSLNAPDAGLRRHLAGGTDLVTRRTTLGFNVAAVFDDLVAGVSEARLLARQANATVGLALSEALSSRGDPLGPLRQAWGADKTG